MARPRKNAPIPARKPPVQPVAAPAPTPAVEEVTLAPEADLRTERPGGYIIYPNGTIVTLHCPPGVAVAEAKKAVLSQFKTEDLEASAARYGDSVAVASVMMGGTVGQPAGTHRVAVFCQRLGAGIAAFDVNPYADAMLRTGPHHRGVVALVNMAGISDLIPPGRVLTARHALDLRS